ncbi:MAG TPA: MmgE/PrpD family protein [Stellaceae bacterium]|jgi:2-methylcitrate dehydratase PrpD|nr:MmgE/PrpD family protein [Stellaceae bacterium]
MAQRHAASVAETLAAAIAGLDAEHLPAALRAMADNLILDIFGLCLAGRGTDYVRAALDGIDGDGGCTVIGHERRCDSAGAALINGTAAHGEDFDDTFEGGPVHAGAVIVPAVLAAAERFDLDGKTALLGIAVGVETTCRLSLVAPRLIHKAGFHPTSVFGTLGAAAAVGAALRLDSRQLVDAFGIAGSMASGIIEYLADGSWTKRLHPGWAAQAGLRAALLARQGFQGPRSVFEGTHGLFNGFAHTTAGNYAKLTGGFGQEWVAETLAFKPYACGTMTHPYIDCAIRLAARGIKAEAIDSIVCEVAEGTVHRLWEPLALKQAPPNPYAGKFSGPFCIAVGFITGDAGLAAFTDAMVANPRIRALAAKVRFVVDPDNPYPDNYTGHLRATLRDGSVVEERQPHLRGGAHEKLSPSAIEAKFFANATFGGWSAERAAAARDLARRIFEGPIDLAALRG